MKDNNEGFSAHAFICTRCTARDKTGAKCSNTDADTFRDEIKTKAKELWNKKTVRVNKSGCLGHCEKGINAVIYPQNIWLHHLKSGDEDKVLDHIEKALDGQY
jgi:predicted metal-binding protein